MKKRFSLILVCILTMIMTLSGCNLFQTNMDKYLNEVVATVNGIEITKEELIKMVNNNYETYSSQYGMTLSEIIDYSLENIMMQKLLITETEKLVSEGKIEITNYQKNEIWRDTFKSLNSNLKTYEEEVKKSLGIDESALGEEEVVGDSTYVYAPYAPQAKVIWDSVKSEYVIVKLDEEEIDPVENFLLDESDFKYESISSDKIKNDAWKKYINQLKKNENGRNLSKDEAGIWSREVNRVYKNVNDVYYMKRVLEYYEVEYETTVKDVLNAFIMKARDGYINYVENPSSFTSSLSSDASSVFYIPKEEETYFYVGHILIQYSAEQLETINYYKTLVSEGSMSQTEYEERIENMKKLIRATERDENGTIISTHKTVQDVLAEINLAMRPYTLERESIETQMKTATGTALENLEASLKAVEQNIANVFNGFMYRYGQDPGILNATSLYTIGEETTTMMESFTEASRILHDAGRSSTYTSTFEELAYAERESSGTVDYGGYHIIFYAGTVKNIFEFADYTNLRLDNESVYTLANTRINALSNKTYFDLIYDELNSSISYSIFENAFVEQLLGNADKERYVDRYADLKG